MSSRQIAAPPLTTPIAGNLFLTQNWADWGIIQALAFLQSVASVVAAPVTLTGQHASLGATAFNIKSVTAGLYRMGWTARVTTAASVSSSLTVSVAYTRLGISCTQTSAAMVGNSTSLPVSGEFILHSDGASPILFSTTYASSGSPAMSYELDAFCENVA